jgi:Fe-S oxidoreductase
MPEWHGWQKLKYEAELDPKFADEITAIPAGKAGQLYSVRHLQRYVSFKHIHGLYPAANRGDGSGRFKGEVLSSYTSWLCASCYACTVECPKGIKITDIMYS